jgi:hypothetical protein
MIIFFQKIVPVDEKFLLLIGGTSPTSDYKDSKPSLLDMAYKEPESSLFLVEVVKHPYKVIAKQRLSPYLHAAAALW